MRAKCCVRSGRGAAVVTKVYSGAGRNAAFDAHSRHIVDLVSAISAKHFYYLLIFIPKNYFMYIISRISGNNSPKKKYAANKAIIPMIIPRSIAFRPKTSPSNTA